MPQGGFAAQDHPGQPFVFHRSQILPNSYEMSMPTWSAPAPHEMGCPWPQLPV